MPSDTLTSTIPIPDLWKAAHRDDRARPRARQQLLGPSSIGLCRRRAAYEAHGTWPTDLADTMHAAILGTWLHEGILRVLEQQYGAFTELELTNGTLLGHADAYWAPAALAGRTNPYNGGVGVVEDLKTKSTRALDMVVRQGPSRNEWFQVHLYAYLLRTGGLTAHPDLPVGEPLPVDVVRLRYVGREYGQVVVHQRPYDQDVADQALSWAEDVLASPEPEAMPRDLDGPGLSVICDNCPFKSACWNLDALTVDRAPQTILVEGSEDITSALSAYAESAEIESAAKKRKAKARKVLDAAEPGAYGTFRLSWSGGNPRPPVPDPEAMIRILQDLDLEVPLKSGGRSSRTINVSRLSDAP
ncbi:PD-(D/E)XK nuclease family protein [Streptomyces luteolus]|uniref:PD-(D/E)XK nuclease family protein n=1 Tax=Streptomyces luteolus TaxID=3043615 RepID=A0ABT6SQW0_9ACTN|nr:PD-(D/E)XK nuclease family protein [Streptomyces sp. B-S-A12]MDI3417997.1 PD-(D/E)XK nuclease family protein [Streptomyces sp. B-S-A12]